MSFRQRAGIVGVLIIIGLAAYGTARFYSPSLVVYVVEQALIQKAPPGYDAALIRSRFHALLAALPDKNAKLARVLAMSQYLEKVQALTPQELQQLLSVTPETTAKGPP
jgi:hypothetical protein